MILQREKRLQRLPHSGRASMAIENWFRPMAHQQLPIGFEYELAIDLAMPTEAPRTL